MAERHRPLRVVVVGDDWMLAGAIVRAAENAERVRDAKRFATVEEALEDARFQLPDVVFVVPTVADDLEAVRRFLQRVAAHTRAIVAPHLPRNIRVLLDLGCAGVVSPIDLTDESDTVDCISAVAAGLVVLSARARDVLLREDDEPASALALRYGLSRRETDALLLLAEGLPNKRIATQLRISEQTVKNILVRAYRKLGTKGRVSAARLVLQEAAGAVRNDGMQAVPKNGRPTD